MNHRSLLARATEGTDAPTPGYLYIDLAKAATGNPSTCQDMAKYLTNRLGSRQNPNIKFKCCKVIAKLCEQVPRNAFRRCIAQDHDSISAIKESMNFRGTVDPVLGDEPNQRVRIAAKEALDAVYSEAPVSDMPNAGGGGAGYGAGISSSYGPSPHSGGGPNGGGGMGGARRMEGIGNPRYTDPRLDPRYNPDMPRGIQGMVKEAGEVLTGMIKDPLARNIPDPVVLRQGHSGSLPGYPNHSGGGSGYNNSYPRPPPGQSDLARQTGGQWTMASNRGPGAVTSEYDRNMSTAQQYGGSSTSVRTGGVGGSWGSAPSQQSHSTPSITINTIPGASSGGGGGGSAVSDGTYERNLVLELCPAGGMKPVPPPDKLASFARACPTLNSDLICPVLLDCLEEGQPWVIRAKALCVMETCISSGTRLSDGINPYRDFFHACQDEIVPLVSHARAAIRDPAKRVLQLLDIAFDSSVTTLSAPVAAAPHHQAMEAPNLLDFDDDPVSVAPAPASMPPPPPTEAPPVPQTTPTAAPITSSNMFGGMQLKAPAPSDAIPQRVPTAPTMSLLDFDAPSPPVATAPIPDSNTSNDLLANNNLGGTPTATLFDQLNLNGTPNDNTANLASFSAVATGGSAFGFINGGADTTVSSSPSKPVFDPLKTGSTPNSAGQQKKTMQLSTEQLQAMAFQQMMMQQQYQQMQLAAMQQQGTGFSPAGMVVPMHPPLGGGNPSNPMMNQQMAMNIRFAPGGVVPGGGGVGIPGGFSFMNNNAPKPAQKDDKKFDFVKDAMFSAKK